jgi:hypothetical protein
MACETAVSPDERSGGSHSSAAPKHDPEKAGDAALVDKKVSKNAENAPSSEPAVDEMSVFSRPRTEEDVLPSSLAYVWKDKPCDDWERSRDLCLGKVIADQSRLVLTGLGVKRTSLYAWPTTNGSVCWAMADGGGGCIRDFSPGGRGTRTAFMGIDPDDDGVGDPGALLGLVPDDVSAVTVKVGGIDEQQPVVVKSNGVFYELPDGSCSVWAFESLTTTYRDGTSDTVPIDWRNGDEPMPDTCDA